MLSTRRPSIHYLPWIDPGFTRLDPFFLAMTWTPIAWDTRSGVPIGPGHLSTVGRNSPQSIDRGSVDVPSSGAKTPQHTGPSQVDQIRAAKFEKMNKARFGSSESSEGSGPPNRRDAATPGTVPLRLMRRAEAGGPLDRRSVDEEEKRVRQRPSSERCGWVHAPGGSREA